eukprot:1944968-Prorocentrum_lima.AAC.1
MVSGSTLDVINVSGDEADMLRAEATVVIVHRLHALGDLSPNLFVCDPLLVPNFSQGSTQPHTESA